MSWIAGPVLRNPNLAAYEGEWVATDKHGEVVAHAPSSLDRVPLVRALDGNQGDYLIQRVHRPGDPVWMGGGSEITYPASDPHTVTRKRRDLPPLDDKVRRLKGER